MQQRLGATATVSEGAAACRAPAVCQWRDAPPPLPTAIVCAVYNKDLFILVSVFANATAKPS